MPEIVFLFKSGKLNKGSMREKARALEFNKPGLNSSFATQWLCGIREVNTCKLQLCI